MRFRLINTSVENIIIQLRRLINREVDETAGGSAYGGQGSVALADLQVRETYPQRPRAFDEQQTLKMKQHLTDTLLYILFIMLALVTYGWHYGWGNGAALIPAMYHIMDPSYLANDLHAGEFPIYIRALTWLMAQMANVIPLPLLFFAFQVLSICLLFYAVRKLSDALMPNEPLFGWFMVFVLIVYRFFIPGANLIIGTWILFESTFYMYTLGYAVSLLALVYLARGKVLWAGVLAGLAFYVQLNHGQQTVLLFAGAIVISQERLAEKAKQLGLFMLVVVVLSLPVLVPAFIDQVLSMHQSSESAMSGPSFYDVLRFRHSHHLQPAVWPMTHHVMFVLQIIGTGYLFKLRKRVAWENVDRVFSRTFVVVIALCAIGYINDLLRIEVVDKSYLFRTSVIGAIITVAYSCWAIWHFLLSKIRRETFVQLHRLGIGGVGVYTIVAFVLCYNYPGLFTGWRSKICPGLTFTLQMTPLEEYIKDRTPRDAVFLVSPDYVNFAVNTWRAEVVNWMAIPFNGNSFREWYHRVVAVTNGKITIESMSGVLSDAIQDSVGVAYRRLPPESVLAIAKKYHAQYCVFTDNLPFPAEYRWNNLALYKIQ